jgi:hypothetical protein
VLAGNAATGVAADFPDHASYVVGADVAVNNQITVAFGVLGRYVMGAKRLTRETFHALDGRSTFANIAFEDASFAETNGTFGLKVNVYGRLLLNLNLAFSLDRHGLRDRVTPLVGIDYTF